MTFSPGSLSLRVKCQKLFHVHNVETSTSFFRAMKKRNVRELYRHLCLLVYITKIMSALEPIRVAQYIFQPFSLSQRLLSPSKRPCFLQQSRRYHLCRSPQTKPAWLILPRVKNVHPENKKSSSHLQKIGSAQAFENMPLQFLNYQRKDPQSPVPPYQTNTRRQHSVY